MRKILIIEDNVDVRENTAEILQLAGYEVITAENGKLGVDAAINQQPELIICDIMMPLLDGYGVLHLLGKNTLTQNIPFIFLSAKSERTDIRKGMEMGADDYITKPFDDIELLNAVESRFRKLDLSHRELPQGQAGMNELLSKIGGIHDITKIAEKQQIKIFRKKDLIFSEGDTPAGLYLLKSGKAKSYKSHELGKDLITRMLQPGDFFGYVSLLEDTDQQESSEALEDCEVVIFSKDDFFKLIFQSPAASKQFVKLLTGKIAEEEDRLLSLAYSSVRKRAADALLVLRKRYHDGGDQPFRMAISREDLANMVGTATESLIRTLSDFREEEIVEIHGSTITIKNLEKLQKMRN
jgi:CRP-like cAMP-binding protein/DNA-binding NarL/FixJ family response regulator